MTGTEETKKQEGADAVQNDATNEESAQHV